MTDRSVQRFLANDRNLVRTAALVPSSVKPIANAVMSLAQFRDGNGQVKVSGTYTGEDDALYDVEIVDTAATLPIISKPTFSGLGNGTLSALTASGIDAQTFTVTLSDLGLELLAAQTEFEGVKIRARAMGVSGNSVHIHVDNSPLVFSDTQFSTIEDIRIGATDGLKGAQFDWDTKVLGGGRAIPAAAHRVAFGDDTNSVHVQYKEWKKDAWNYGFTPALAKDIPKGTKVKFVTGGRTVTVSDGTTTETYNNVVSIYDFLNAVRTTSTLVDISGAVANDRAPGGQASIEFKLRTDAYAVASTSSAKVAANGFEGVTIGALANTEVIEARCIAANAKDRATAGVGAEVWALTGSVSGALGEIVSGNTYIEPSLPSKFALRVPRRVPDGFDKPRGKFSVTSISYASRAANVAPPDICVAGMTLGPSAVDQTITLKYTKRPAKTCGCDDLPFPDFSRDECLTGVAGTGGGPLSDIQPRQDALYALRKDWYTRVFDGVKPYESSAPAFDAFRTNVETDFTSISGLLKQLQGRVNEVPAVGGNNKLGEDWDALRADYVTMVEAELAELEAQVPAGSGGGGSTDPVDIIIVEPNGSGDAVSNYSLGHPNVLSVISFSVAFNQNDLSVLTEILSTAGNTTLDGANGIVSITGYANIKFIKYKYRDGFTRGNTVVNAIDFANQAPVHLVDNPPGVLSVRVMDATDDNFVVPASTYQVASGDFSWVADPASFLKISQQSFNVYRPKASSLNAAGKIKFLAAPGATNVKGIFRKFVSGAYTTNDFIDAESVDVAGVASFDIGTGYLLSNYGFGFIGAFMHAVLTGPRPRTLRGWVAAVPGNPGNPLTHYHFDSYVADQNNAVINNSNAIIPTDYEIGVNDVVSSIKVYCWNEPVGGNYNTGEVAAGDVVMANVTGRQGFKIPTAACCEHTIDAFNRNPAQFNTLEFGDTSLTYDLVTHNTNARVRYVHGEPIPSPGGGNVTFVFDPSQYNDRRRSYDAWIDRILARMGKFDVSTVGGDGCWRDRSDAFYWDVKGNVGGKYDIAFNNYPYVSSRIKVDGKTHESTREFAFQINVAPACIGQLKEGDTVTLSIGDAAWPPTYQVGDTMSLSIVAAQDLFLQGGQAGTNLQTWYINGSVDGPRAPYVYDPAAPVPYSAAGLGFTLTPGTIPFAENDQFKFSIEGGHYRWRKDAGAWSSNLDINTAALAFTDGLTIQFVPGAAPSFTPMDLHKFRVLQPHRVANLRTPNFDQWAWTGADATLEIDFGAATAIDAIMLTYHTLPSAAALTIEFGTTPGVYGTPVPLSWRERVIGKLLDTPVSARYALLTITGAASGRIGWLWLGSMLAAECCQGQTSLRYDYNVERAGLINGGAQAYGKTVSGEVKWDTGALTDADRVNFVAMLDHIKLNHDEPVVIYPHYLHEDEAYLARILNDQIEIADWNLYHPNDKANRALSVTLPFEGVIL
jgi:hypothetical protein